MAQQDAKDILREIKAEIEGVDPKDIQFKDLRDKKKKVKKVEKTNESESGGSIIDNKEGFSIDDLNVVYCDYSNIGKRSFKEKNSLEEWGPYDFFDFAQKLYIKKYKVRWDLNRAGNSLEINKVRDKLEDAFGFCCNLMLRDHIVFFFDHYIDNYKNKNGFYFSQLRMDWIINSFKDSYNYRERFSTYILKEKQKNKKYELTKVEMQKSYDMGETTLVGNYGVVIALNWLLTVKRKAPDHAVKIVVDACKEMFKRDMIDIVKKATEAYSPYPSNLSFKNPQLIFNKIDRNIQLNVEFNDSDKMKFLQKRR